MFESNFDSHNFENKINFDTHDPDVWIGRGGDWFFSARKLRGIQAHVSIVVLFNFPVAENTLRQAMKFSISVYSN